MLTADSVQWTGVSPLVDARTWEQDAIRSLGRLSELEENWDRRGSPRINRDLIELAARIIQSIERSDVPAPNIGPVTGGGIQLEWELGEKGIELEILPDGSLEYLIENADYFLEGEIPVVGAVNSCRTLIDFLFE